MWEEHGFESKAILLKETFLIIYLSLFEKKLFLCRWEISDERKFQLSDKVEFLLPKSFCYFDLSAATDPIMQT